jgi:hypothetical protein
VAYLTIGIFLWKKGIVGLITRDKRMDILRRKRQRVKMLIMVVMVFSICWFPLNLYHMLTDFGLINYQSTLFFLCHWFAMSSVCYNPFIYCWLNEKFKRQVKSIFGCVLRKRKPNTRHEDYSNGNNIDQASELTIQRINPTRHDEVDINSNHSSISSQFPQEQTQEYEEKLNVNKVEVVFCIA